MKFACPKIPIKNNFNVKLDIKIRFVVDTELDQRHCELKL